MKWDSEPDRWRRRIAKWQTFIDRRGRIRIARRRIALALLSLGLLGWFMDWYRWFGHQCSDPIEQDVELICIGSEG